MTRRCCPAAIAWSPMPMLLTLGARIMSVHRGTEVLSTIPVEADKQSSSNEMNERRPAACTAARSYRAHWRMHVNNYTRGQHYDCSEFSEITRYVFELDHDFGAAYMLSERAEGGGASARARTPTANVCRVDAAGWSSC